MTLIVEHLNQAKKNLKFLESVNSLIADSTDWQVTTCFYTALHVINAHIANFGMRYAAHHSVNDVINPTKTLSITKVSEDAYVAYKSLYNLSRRSRYLVVLKGDHVDLTAPAAMTYDKHLAKAFRHLDIVLKYYTETYGVPFDPISIKCQEIRIGENLSHYNVIR